MIVQNMNCRVAVVQFKIKQFGPKENLAKIENYIQKAVRDKADIIVFPEDCVIGSIEEGKEFADINHKYRNHFQNLAKKYTIDIVTGTIGECEKKRYYNTAYYIDSMGKVKGQYRKVHLWVTEKKFYTPGKDICVINTRFGKIGLVVCWDLAFPEIFRTMKKKGVQMVFCSSYWSYEDAGYGMKFDKKLEARFIDALCLARAYENEIAVVQCNTAGKVLFKDGFATSVGHSQITVPFKGVVKKMNHNREGMFVENVDLNILKLAEQNYQIERDLKQGIVI